MKITLLSVVLVCPTLGNRAELIETQNRVTDLKAYTLYYTVQCRYGLCVAYTMHALQVKA